MPVEAANLDSSVARLLILAEKIERRDVAGPFVSAVPEDPPPVVIPDPPFVAEPEADAPVIEALVDEQTAIEAPVDELADDEDAFAWMDDGETAAESVADESGADDVDLGQEIAPVAATEQILEAAEPTVDPAVQPVEAALEAAITGDDAEPVDEPMYLEPVSVLVVPTAHTEDEPAQFVSDRPEDMLARLEQVRAELTDLAARRRRPRGRRRLEDARREERELLDKLGFDSYLDLMLTNAGTRQSESMPGSSASDSRENGDLVGSGGGDGGGGANADIGTGGSAFGVPMAPPPPPPSVWFASPPEASLEPTFDDDGVEDEPQFAAVAEEGGGADDEAADEAVSPTAVSDPFTSGAPTIADWLASPLAPPSAASSSVDVDA
jgi:hypothetical protein